MKNDVGSWSWGRSTVADECAELGLFFCSIMESVPEEVHVATAHGHYLLQQQAQRQQQ